MTTWQQFKDIVCFAVSDFWIPASTVAVVASVVSGAVWYSSKSDRQEIDMIQSGQCRIELSAVYQPPPTMICAAPSPKGGCLMMTPIQAKPYMRDLWQCEGGTKFWRRQDT